MLARTLVGTKAFGAMQWAWARLGLAAGPLAHGLAPGGLWLPQWPLLPEAWVAVLTNLLLPLSAGSTSKPELVSPRTSTQVVSTLSQDTFTLKSSCPVGPQQALKRRYPEEETQSKTTYSPPTERCRIEDGPAHSAEASKPSTSTQGAAQLVQGKCPIKTSSSPSRPRQAFKRGFPEEDNDSGMSNGPPAKRRRIDNGPTQSADESGPSPSRQAVAGPAEGTLEANSQAAQPRRPYRPPWIFHGSTTDNRSQPGPIRLRHVWRQQRREKKPYSRPENNSGTKRPPGRSPHQCHPSR